MPINHLNISEGRYFVICNIWFLLVILPLTFDELKGIITG